MAAPLLVPVALWGGPPEHVPTALAVAGDELSAVTASESGPLVLWSLDRERAPEPRALLCGHGGEYIIMACVCDGGCESGASWRNMPVFAPIYPPVELDLGNRCNRYSANPPLTCPPPE